MSMKEAILSAFQNYCCFTGRARRSEYWYFVLFNVIVSTCLSGLYRFTEFSLLSTLQGLYSLAVFLPGLGLSWRRLHDVGKSGGYIFMVLIPLVGPFLVLFKLCADSQPGDNRFGANPKGVGGQQEYGYQAPVSNAPVYDVPKQEVREELTEHPLDGGPYGGAYVRPLVDTPAPDYRTFNAENTWTCPYCGEHVADGKFCPNCGGKRPEQQKQRCCASCGYTPGPEEGTPKFCPNCGKPF